MNKPVGRHKSQQLTVKAIDAISEPGRYPDGGGLYLVAENKSAKRWLLRTTIKGQTNSAGKPLRRDIGLGSYPMVGLSEVRDLAREFVKAARSGDDPTVTLRKRIDATPDFETLARNYYQKHKHLWKNEVHRSQWIGTLEQYVFPAFGKRPIDQITTPEIVAVLSAIWFDKHKTARRIKQRIATVFDDAKGKGHLIGENPVAGVSASLKSNKRLRRPKHHAAMDYRDLPAFMARLRGNGIPAMSRLALEFTILTAARTGEVIHARWDEIDTDKALWIVPDHRMKAGEEHRVPLSDRALEILATVKPITQTSGWLFGGQLPDKPMSNRSMLELLKRMQVPVTVHGFRSTFRDWCGETTGFPHAAIEKCLAHEVASAVERAYARSDLLDKRREVMAAWAAYALSAANTVGNVISLGAR